MIAKCALVKAPRIFLELNFTLNHSSLATLSFISFTLKPLSPEFHTRLSLKTLSEIIACDI